MVKITDVNYWLAIAAEDIRREKIDAEYEEELMNEELNKQYEMMSYSAELENFSPFDTINS